MFTTAPEFVDAALGIMPAMKFFPAELAGQKMRQVVCTPFAFTTSYSKNRVVDSLANAWIRERGCPSKCCARCHPEERSDERPRCGEEESLP
jgi:hypothetical protein